LMPRRSQPSAGSVRDHGSLRLAVWGGRTEENTSQKAGKWNHRPKRKTPSDLQEEKGGKDLAEKFRGPSEKLGQRSQEKISRGSLQGIPQRGPDTGKRKRNSLPGRPAAEPKEGGNCWPQRRVSLRRTLGHGPPATPPVYWKNPKEKKKLPAAKALRRKHREERS